MALNPASHNPSNSSFFEYHVLLLSVLTQWYLAGEKTGPVTGPPPQASSETMTALLGAAKEDPTSQHEGEQAGANRGEETKIGTGNESMDPS